jgi:NADPH2:quinone reductase
VTVRVEAAGINYLDVYQRSGSVKMPTPTTFTPGFEGVGRVLNVGDGVTGLKAGSRVAWINSFGSYAEQVALPVEQAIMIPESFNVDQAMLFQGITAQYLLAEYRAVRPGDVVLVHAAAGGVGQWLVQWLKHLGAVVIGTASNEDKLKTIRSLGADHAVNYSNGFLEQIRDLTSGRGVDLALDAVGQTTFSDTVKALAPRGMAISYGQASGIAPDVQVLPLILKGARVAGASLFVYIGDPKEMQARAAEVIAGVQEGWLRMTKSTTFALDDVVASHRAIEGRSTQGKLVLIP